MNLFFLSHDTKDSAKYHCDKHVVKMILEYAQLLCTAHRMLDGQVKVVNTNGRNMKRYVLDNTLHDDIFYKATHYNHPSAVWTRQSDSNYVYLYQLFCDLCDEYTFRYGKIHMTDTKLRSLLSLPPSNIKGLPFKVPPCCMPDHCIVKDNPIASYQKYYKVEKSYMAAWTKRPIPDFM